MSQEKDPLNIFLHMQLLVYYKQLEKLGEGITNGLVDDGEGESETETLLDKIFHIQPLLGYKNELMCYKEVAKDLKDFYKNASTPQLLAEIGKELI
jgi:hypothetical protein